MRIHPLTLADCRALGATASAFVLAGALATLTLTACGGDGAPAAAAAAASSPATGASTPSTTSKLSLAAQVGAKMFVDTNLSGSGKLACSSCHDPQSAYGPPNAVAVQVGGTDMQQP